MSSSLSDLELIVAPIPFAKRATGTHDARPAPKLSDLEALDRAHELAQVDADTIERLARALTALPVHYADDRHSWAQVGMALKSLADAGHDAEAREMWHAFSQRCPHKYDYEQCETDFETFDPRTVTFKKIFHLAKTEGIDIGKPKPEPRTLRKFEAVPAAEFSAGKPLSWFIKGVLPQAGLGVLYGPSGAGKSFLALDIVARVAEGVDWQAKRTRRARVTYVVAEGVAGFRRRLQALAIEHKIDLANLDLMVIADAPDLTSADDGQALTDELSRVATDLVVIDTLAQTMAGADENSAQDMGEVVKRCRQIYEATGAMVLLVHHSGKDASKGARGSSVLRAACDFEAEVTRDEHDNRAMRLSKMKDGEDGLEFHFKLKASPSLGLDEDGEDITSCHIEYCDAPAKVEKVDPPKGVNERAVWDALRELAPDGLAVKTEDVITAAVAKIAEQRDAEGKDRRRQIIRRAVQSLISTRRISQEYGEMWLEW